MYAMNTNMQPMIPSVESWENFNQTQPQAFTMASGLKSVDKYVAITRAMEVTTSATLAPISKEVAIDTKHNYKVTFYRPPKTGSTISGMQMSITFHDRIVCIIA